ncbi:hypothetical protein DERP_007073 [Dermatophagoides pteronyssinus]|uniref:Uncharacterized protein n=1 Tax=Dermatophagoides pteronyssinus TaxID=6956 RepID=A0ABQ8JU33_DERPT|nr:hypothetical protein DERP_007073 [Dermatophagoides pteronyssinus]
MIMTIDNKIKIYRQLITIKIDSQKKICLQGKFIIKTIYLSVQKLAYVAASLRKRNGAAKKLPIGLIASESTSSKKSFALSQPSNRSCKRGPI